MAFLPGPDSRGLPGPGLLARLCWVLALGLAALGCRARSDHMAPSSAALGAPSAELAQVVFIRPSAFAGNLLITICDDQGKFLGDAPPVSHFSVGLPPGRHTFVAWAENTAALRAEVAAGQTYFVEVALQAGSMTPRVELFARKPRTEPFALVPTWLAQTDRLEAERAAGQASLSSRHDDLAERLTQGAASLAGLDPAELELRRLQPGDGVAGVPFANLAPPPPPLSASPAATAGASAGVGSAAAAAPPPSAATSITPTRTAACQTHGDCTPGHICIGGGCALAVACSGDDAECPTGTTCQEGVCRP
ncbi:MAG: hypothetical protein JRI68_10885 [Deltaproteobacteria bacterium]|nr:hypothetical protein [Deltaproteobacteria bacterium]